MKKIIVIGCPGSGKSTFSRALQEVTGIPLHYLDQMYWNSDRTTVDKEVFRERLKKVMQEEAWIIDGNYSSTMEWRMEHCDTVFFLDYPTEVCLDGVYSRAGKPRPDMPWAGGDLENDAEFIDAIKRYNEEQRPKVLRRLEKCAGKEVYIFNNRKEADSFLAKLRKK